MAFVTSSHHLKPPVRSSNLRTLSDPSADRQTRVARQIDPENSHGNLDARSPTPTDGPVAAALPTPHDAVLAELQGLRDGGQQAAHMADMSRNAPRLSVIPSVGSLERTERTATPSGGLPRSATSTLLSRLVAIPPHPSPVLSGLSALCLRPQLQPSVVMNGHPPTAVARACPQ